MLQTSMLESLPCLKIPITDFKAALEQICIAQSCASHFTFWTIVQSCASHLTIPLEISSLTFSFLLSPSLGEWHNLSSSFKVVIVCWLFVVLFVYLFWFIDSMSLGSPDCLELSMQPKLGSSLEPSCISFHVKSKGMEPSCLPHILYLETILYMECTWLNSQRYLDHSDNFLFLF